MGELDRTKDISEVLLINPPFGTVTSPYISIPVLAAYLRNRNIPVSAYDMKREFYVRLLVSQNILRGLRYVKERFIELNDKSQLNFSELFEYRMLLTIFSEMQVFKKETEKLIYPFANFSDIQNSKAINFFIRVATFSLFPEILIPEFSFSVGSAYTPHSSSDILKACNHHNYYTRLFEKIIDDKILSEHHPQIIGFSVVFTSQIIPAFQCARIVKERLPNVHITMGGPCISVYFREVQEKQLFGIIDSFVLDEGEIPLETLARELPKQNPDLSKVPGLVYLANDHIHFNSPAPSLNIKQSPPPDYNVFQLDNYLFSRNKLMLPLRLSKGCRWQKCTFCRTNLPMCRDYQQLPMELSYNQLVHVVKTTGASSFLFSDETVDPKVMEYTSKRLLEDQIQIRWVAHTRVSKLLTKKRAELYREAGCKSLRLGIESLSDRILKLMKKGITVELIEEVLHKIDGTLPIFAYMMIGFPTETEEEALKGHERLNSFVSKGLIDGYSYSLFNIVFGSDIWNHSEKYGISKFLAPEGSDLFPNIINFKSTGMPREKAHRLALTFNQSGNNTRKNLPTCELLVDNEMIPLRYNSQTIAEFLTKRSFTDLPLVRWFNVNNEIIFYP